MIIARPARRGFLMLAALLAAGCKKDDTDAWGTFESTETRVSSELAGRLIRLDVTEGAAITAGALVAVVDTSALVLQRQELVAKRATTAARTREIDANLTSAQSQLAIAQRDLDRMTRLKAAEAATAQQVDNAQKAVTVLTQQIEALKASRGVIDEELRSTDAAVAELQDRMRRGRIVAPVGGTVVSKIAQQGEFVQPGAPLFSVAALDTLTFRAYLEAEQLTRVHVGSTVWVRTDAGHGTLRTAPGTVTWISATAEFTPTPIQTRTERTTQVYAMKIAVANPDHGLRIGMPGELRFTPDSTTR